MRPGEELINQGLADLAAGNETVPSILVSIGAHRLRRSGVAVPVGTFGDPEHRLYNLLASEDLFSKFRTAGDAVIEPSGHEAAGADEGRKLPRKGRETFSFLDGFYKIRDRIVAFHDEWHFRGPC